MTYTSRGITCLAPPYNLISILTRSDYYKTSHQHDFHQIIIVTDGELKVRCGQMTRMLTSGMAHILPSGAYHELSSQGYSQLGIDILACDCEQASLLAEAFTMPDFIAFPDASNLYEYINVREKTRSRLALAQIRSRLDAAVFDIVSYKEDAEGCNRFAAALSEYFETHLSENIRLADAAGHMFISVSHLERLSRRSFGTGAMECLRKKRFEKACILLVTTNLSIKDIGALVGFPEVSGFSAFFRRNSRISPSKYRITKGKIYS